MSSAFDLDDHFIELTHGATRYFEQGSGEPCILLHGAGFAGGATSWLRNIDDLAADFRVIVPDMPGWGIGDRIERHLAFPYLVDFVRELQDGLGIEQSHLVGHSLGGWISQVFAYESPDRVNRLALIASAGHDSVYIPPSLKNFQPPSREQLNTEIAKFPGLSTEHAAKWADAEWRNISSPKAADSYRQMLEFMTFAEERERYITPRRWTHIRNETLVVSGKDDGGYPPEVGKRMAESIPNARLVVFETGHMIPMEKPEELNQLLIEFLGKGL